MPVVIGDFEVIPNESKPAPSAAPPAQPEQGAEDPSEFEKSKEQLEWRLARVWAH